ncbi:Transcription factor TFIIIB component B [Globomyces sp. JEL0801]|nr:Transcription factor TFIIIB component B [Globomyces sp. JEL0801]
MTFTDFGLEKEGSTIVAPTIKIKQRKKKTDKKKPASSTKNVEELLKSPLRSPIPIKDFTTVGNTNENNENDEVLPSTLVAVSDQVQSDGDYKIQSQETSSAFDLTQVNPTSQISELPSQPIHISIPQGTKIPARGISITIPTKSASIPISNPSQSQRKRPSFSSPVAETPTTPHSTKLRVRRPPVDPDNIDVESATISELIYHRYPHGQISSREKARIEKDTQIREDTKIDQPVTTPVLSRDPSRDNMLSTATNVSQNKFILDKDGNLVLNTGALQQAQQYDVIEDNGDMIEEEAELQYVTNSSFRKKKRLNVFKWSEAMNDRFYLGLNYFGMDLKTISFMFPLLTHNHIKRKFKKEQQTNPHRITASIRNHIPAPRSVRDKILASVATKKRLEAAQYVNNRSPGSPIKSENLFVSKEEPHAKLDDTQPNAVENSSFIEDLKISNTEANAPVEPTTPSVINDLEPVKVMEDKSESTTFDLDIPMPVIDDAFKLSFKPKIGKRKRMPKLKSAEIAEPDNVPTTPAVEEILPAETRTEVAVRRPTAPPTILSSRVN